MTTVIYIEFKRKKMKVGTKTFDIKATVLRVVDGDTIEVRADALFDIQAKLTFRLMGIDTPEIHSKIESEKAKAKEAKQWLIDKIEGKDVFLRTYKDKEKFGRYLADIFLTDPTKTSELFSVNMAMIDLGFAKYYDGGKKI